MTESKTAQSATTLEEQRENLSFKRYLQVSFWVIKFVFSINPRNSWLYLITKGINRLTPIIQVYLSARLIDGVINVVRVNGQLSDTFPYLGMLFGVSILSSIPDALENYSRSTVLDYAGTLSNKRFYEYLMYLGVQTLEDPIVANKVTRAEAGLNSMNYYFQTGMNFVITLVTFVVSLVIVGKEFPIIIPPILVLSAPWFLFDMKLRIKDWKLWYEVTDARKRSWASAGRLSDPAYLNEISVIGAGAFLSKKFMEFQVWFLNQRDIIRKGFAASRFLNLLSSLSYYLGYILVVRRALAGTISIGSIVFYVDLINRLSNDFQEVISEISNSYESCVRFTDAYELFHMKPLIPEGHKVLEDFTHGPEIKIENLSFAYPRSEKSVFANLSLDIKSGEKLAIVGHNGAGKTTLAKLLSRIYIPTEGKILINDIPTVDIKSSSLHKNMSVLFQEYNNYPELTVAENVAIGNSDKEINHEEVEAALTKADAWEFVTEFPNGLNQVLSPRYFGGTRPSSGQWQKIAIARFFYRNAPFVIFDEPTAAIDAVSEYNIFNKIYEFFEGKTVILISHRFSTVRNADRIVVMENGKIIEQGTHKELIANDGYYAKSFRLQAEGYASEPVESIV